MVQTLWQIPHTEQHDRMNNATSGNWNMTQFCSGCTHKRVKAGTRTGVCTSMFTAALFTGAQTWEQPKHLSADKTWSTRTVEYYSALKKENILTQFTPRMNPRYSMLSEINQTRKVNTVSFHPPEISREVSFMRTESKMRMIRVG